jgi:hypothetical protein
MSARALGQFRWVLPMSAGRVGKATMGHQGGGHWAQAELLSRLTAAPASGGGQLELWRLLRQAPAEPLPGCNGMWGASVCWLH